MMREEPCLHVSSLMRIYIQVTSQLDTTPASIRMLGAKDSRGREPRALNAFSSATMWTDVLIFLIAFQGNHCVSAPWAQRDHGDHGYHSLKIPLLFPWKSELHVNVFWSCIPTNSLIGWKKGWEVGERTLHSIPSPHAVELNSSRLHTETSSQSCFCCPVPFLVARYIELPKSGGSYSSVSVLTCHSGQK